MKICLTCEGVTVDDAVAPVCAHCGGPLLDTLSVHFPTRRGEEDLRSPLVGQVVDGKYRVVGVLGRGGMGIVYRAVHEVSLVHVALKVLHPRFAAREDFRAWFLGEARKAGRVVHENSARIMDVGVARDGMVYMAVEFVDGLTFDEWRGGKIVEPQVLVALLEQVARALAAAHSAGVVHRDLTPRNVMVTLRDGRPTAKILDFGIAVTPLPSAGDAGAPDIAPAGFANPPYSAPEHLAGEALEGRADLYSLGVLAYEALSATIPVDGDSPREWARATIDGLIVPLRARAGVPRALVRLVDRLLAREPMDRPVDADEVVARLRRIGHPGGWQLATLSVVLLLTSAVAFALAHAPGASSPPFLGVRSGALIVNGDPDRLAVQELRAADLLSTRFEFAGFDPIELEVLVTDADGRTDVVSLGDWVRVEGTMIRLASGAAVFADRLARDSESRPAALSFAAGGRALGLHALVRVDDRPPTVSLAVESVGGDVLRAADRLTFGVLDDGRVDVCEIFAEVGRSGESPVARIAAGRTSASASEWLGSAFPGYRSQGPVRLRARAVDVAGNVGWSAPLQFGTVDLAVPDIAEVSGARGGLVLVEGADGARFRARLSGEEPGLALLARAPTASEFLELVGVRAIGDRLDVVLPRGAPSGRWSFVVVDPAGNPSRTFEEDLVIRAADPQLDLALPASTEAGGARALVLLDRQWICASAPQELDVVHNPIYAVDRFRLARTGGDPVPFDAEVQPPSQGRTRVRFGPLAPGTYSIEVRLIEPVEERVIAIPAGRIQVLPEAVVLRVPDAVEARHLREFEERSVLDVGAEGSLSQGAGWTLSPDDSRLVSGRIWSGPLGALVPFETRAGEDPAAPLFQTGSLGRGWHLVLVDLVDVLGRPVRVQIGDAPAPLRPLPDGREGAEVARFFRHDRPFAPVEPRTYVEFMQPLRVEVEAALPAEDLDRVRARVAGAEIAPARRSERAQGGRLVFEIPFERFAVAADLGGLDAEGFAAGVDVQLALGIAFPGGEAEVPISVRTIRSTLRTTTLGEFSARPLPEALASIRLVPVPRPGRPWSEPGGLGEDARRRVRIGPPVAVRSVPDVYVQDREFTRAAYVALIDAGLSQLASGGVDPAALVHAADPLGAARLRRDALLPSGLGAPAGDPSPEALRRGSERPIAGLDGFQAHTAIALLGLVVGDDPQMFRLPLGCELEVAAFGRGTARSGGAQRSGRRFDAEALADLVARGRDAALWPLNHSELTSVGDFVQGELGGTISGLDGGLREWVADLPFPSGEVEGRTTLEEWVGDHRSHVERSAEIAAGGDPDRIPIELRSFLRTYGVLRGTAVRAASKDPGAGVLQVVQLRRDGGGLLPGAVDPRLADCGFRVAGGESFVQAVRQRW
ncbi:MAG: serine/threonine-protein kinase [Planctomycetota bacterium]|nr:serine/threonine-protein kinase [Planctomycetota bacterium]